MNVLTQKKALKLSLSAGKRKLDLGIRHSLNENDSKKNIELHASDHIILTEKSSLNQKTPLLEQSHMMKQPNDVLAINSIDHFSSVVEKKAVESMEYEDFIAELAQQNGQQTQDSSRLKSCESNKNMEEKKRTMSYSEFLGMFKPPPKSEDSKLSEPELQVEKSPTSITETRKEVKYKSVASYFSKAENKPKEIKSLGLTTVTVTAEVHSQSVSKNKQANACTMKLPRKTVVCQTSSNNEDNEIMFLSSETITEVQDNVGMKPVTTKRRNNETVDHSVEVYKKQKIESEVSNKQNAKSLGEVANKEIVEIPSENIERLKDPQSKLLLTTKSSKIVSGNKMSMKTNESKTSFDLIDTEADVSTAAKTLQLSAIKTSQSTLCFGKSGFTIVKAVEPSTNIPADENSCLQAKEDNKLLTRRFSSRRNRTNCENGAERNIHKDNNVKGGHCQETKESEDESSQLSAQKDMQEDTNASIIQLNNMETCGLRRSARLTRSVNTSKSLDVVEIDSDSDEDISSSKNKKKDKQGTSKAFAAGGNSAGSCSKKTAGKLAPVFTLMKSKQQIGEHIRPAVDPEQDRLRREFLMSGIPDELKRQIATTANANLPLDYPPFPKVNHVQQMQEDSCLSSAEVIIPRLTYKFDYESFENIHSIPLLWKNLGWERIPVIECLHKNMFQNFTANSQFPGSQVDLLLKELQNSDEKFQFRRTYANLHSKIASLEVSSCEVSGNNVANACPSNLVTIADDDSIVVIDDSSPVSERNVLKHTSELKALLWSDLHQPDSSEQIIGNTKAIKQLKQWLEEWKMVMEQQEWKSCKLSKKTSKRKGKDDWTDNDSDFTDSEEEMRLCNSVLITGPHGVGKTATVYALAKELGYKVFEVNSSSLRSGKQLLAQLEEATQSHRVAQNKIKTPVFLDTPPAGTVITKTEGKGKDVKHKQKPSASVNHSFANLFRIATPKAEEANNQSRKSMKGKQQKLLVLENSVKNEDLKKKSVKQSNLIITDSVPTKTRRGKKNEFKEEIPNTKVKNHNTKEVGGAVIKKQRGANGQQLPSSGVEIKSQTSSDCNMTSGSLNLTSASLILFDEVDVVFEEDKGFLATVQHFMQSTKIPIVLTSTDLSFSLQLHARHDHINFLLPPLISTASYLSCVCLAHGIRVDHQSVLNAIRYMSGDVRRCLLYLQFWCESAGGLVRIKKNMNPNSSFASSGFVDVVKKLKVDSHLEKTLESVIICSDESSDCEFISLKTLKRKTRQIISDEDDSSHGSTSVIQDNIATSSVKKSKDVKVDLSLQRGRSKRKKVMLDKKENETLKSFKQKDELPLLHIRLEESLLGIHDCDMSPTKVMNFIKSPTLSFLGLDQAVQACSVISQALSIDAIYHVFLHCLPLPKTEIQKAQLTLSAKQKTPEPQTIFCKNSKRRIIQCDWLDSDSSSENFDNMNCVRQDLRKDEKNCHTNNLKDEETISCKHNPEKEISRKCSSKELGTECESKKTLLMVSVLSEFARFYDNLSYIDHLENWPSSASQSGSEMKLIPGLSDDEGHFKLENPYLENRLHHFSAPVRVLAARKLCKSIGDNVNSFNRHYGCQTNLYEAIDVTESNDSGTSPGTSVLSGWPEEFHLPVEKVLPDFCTFVNKVQPQSDSALINVSKCLGPAVCSFKPSLHLDYMPYLRDICRMETERQQAKCQRRFHHYLDNIGLGLKDSTIASLTSTFTVSSGDLEKNI